MTFRELVEQTHEEHRQSHAAMVARLHEETEAHLATFRATILAEHEQRMSIDARRHMLELRATFAPHTLPPLITRRTAGERTP